MFDLIATPFAYIMRLIYNFVNDYGLTIILFTILAKVILWPLNAKSQRSMAAMQKVQPQLAKLQEKYKNDKDKLGMETMKLYQDNNINPMGGCLPMLIQFPLIIAIYQVIIKPITYLMNVDMSVSEIIKMLQQNGFGKNLSATSQQIEVLAEVSKSGLADKIQGFVNIDFNFLGLDLSQVPQAHLGEWMSNFIWIIPVLSLLSAYAMSKLSSSMNQSSAANEQAQQTQKTMLLLMPLMSGYFTLILPAGVGLYWIASNILQMIQQVVITAKIKKEMESSDAPQDAIDVKVKKTKKKKK